MSVVAVPDGCASCGWPSLYRNSCTNCGRVYPAEPEVEPCPVCGSTAACSYDDAGRPLVHTDTELPKD